MKVRMKGRSACLLELLLAMAMAMVMLLPMPAMAGFLSPALQSEVSQFVVTSDLLTRMTAFTKDAQSQGIDLSVKGADPSSAKSIAALAQPADANPKVHALLEKHGLSAHDVVAGSLVLMRNKLAAMSERFVAKDTLNPDNAAFYRKHKTRADALLALYNEQAGGSDTTQLSASDRQQIEDLKNMDMDMLGECTQVGLVVAPTIATYAMAAGPSHYPGGQQSPKNIRELGEQLVKLSDSDDVPQLALKKSISAMGHEIKKQAGHQALEVSPRLQKGMEDYNAWMESHCSKKALQK